MKDYYLIQQIAKLYDIGPDSLRYYEKLGLITPKRSDKGYRMYRLKNLYQLNVIRDLRRLQFSLPQIQDYLANQTIDTTKDLLEQEQVQLRLQMEELAAIQASIAERLETITRYTSQPVGVIEPIQLPSRPALQLAGDIQRDEDIDFLVKRLHHDHESKLYELGNLTFGAIVSPADFAAKNYNVFQSVFILLQPEVVSFDYALPAGDYLRLFYHGSYQASPDWIHQLLDYCQKYGLIATGPALELYHVDNRFTSNKAEFVTEIQLPVIEKNSPKRV